MHRERSPVLACKAILNDKNARLLKLMMCLPSHNLSDTSVMLSRYEGDHHDKEAIAYVRFSNASQQYGDSLRRQNALISEWLSQHPDYELDDTTYQDLGLSAYSGMNATRGALYDFLDAVEHGYIAAGTVLLVESLDRLSREKISDATERLKSILRSGVEVVTLCDHTHYSIDSLDDPYVLIKAILIAQRANEESETKSRRMRAAWQKKREDAAATGKLITRSCPRWLTVSPDGEKFELIEEHARTINVIFRLRLKGSSLNGITKTLNERGVPTLTGEIGRWNPSTIESLLGNKALTGTFTPSYQTMAKGVSEISGYFPQVVPDKLFHDVQGVRLARFGNPGVSDNPYLINIFRSLMYCGTCGHSIILTSVDKKGRGYYACPMRRLKRCNEPAIRRDHVDAALVDVLLCSMDMLQANGTVVGTASRLENRLVELNFSINRLIAALQIAPDVPELAMKVRELSKELRAGELKLRALRSRGVAGSKDWIAALNLADRRNRERCRDYAARHIDKLFLHTAEGRCDVHLLNGIKLINFPLKKKLPVSSFISSLAYMCGDTLIF